MVTVNNPGVTFTFRLCSVQRSIILECIWIFDVFLSLNRQSMGNNFKVTYSWKNSFCIQMRLNSETTVRFTISIKMQKYIESKI